MTNRLAWYWYVVMLPFVALVIWVPGWVVDTILEMGMMP